MHIEDRLSVLEKSSILEDKNDIHTALIDHNIRISKLENYNSKVLHNTNSQGKEILNIKDKNERLEKRLESTEAQIRKLFHLVEELSNPNPKEPKKEPKLADNSSDFDTVNPADSRLDRTYTKTSGVIHYIALTCKHCGVDDRYPIETMTRGVRIESGHITTIGYSFKCYSCYQSIVITF